MALDFDRALTQTFTVPSGGTLNVRGNFTLTAWGYFHTMSNVDQWVTANEFYRRWLVAGDNRQYIMGLLNPDANGQPADCVAVTFAGADGIYDDSWYWNSALSINTLYHFAWVHSGTNFLIYVNADPKTLAKRNSINPPATFKDSAQDTIFATDMDGETFDERMYDRVLSAAEIQTIYHARGADNIVDNLVARWLMNEKPDGGTATVASSVIDISGNGNHGTPANSPVYRAAPVRLVKLIK